ncbi:MAG: type II secretion system minor pseudopilin GspH [Candidatus Thiodiazotropha sp. (ex Cardiolucina cf. quadrata)]|nr:type II secretion system minor pseudopilin GspH [Candidatus Thiodiazotropha sp. (ex Cardiolucina cf. quadrata)]
MKVNHSTTAAANQRGFTLIEVMVVVVIIGILINFVTLSLGRSSPQDQLKTEAQRLSNLIGLASEEALLRSLLIGVDISEEEYGFLRLEEGAWQPMEDNLFRSRQLPEGMEFSIASSQQSGEDDEENIPEIILLNSGEMTPFELKLSSDRLESYYRLTGSEMGERTLDHVSPY